MVTVLATVGLRYALLENGALFATPTSTGKKLT